VSFLYLGALLISIAGMVVLDVRFRLFFAVAPLRAAIVLVAGVAFFLVWDVAGIGLGIFFRGNPGLLTGILIAPELPLEEVFFLTLLCYLTMNLYNFAALRWLRSAPRSGTRPEAGSAGS
jgi:lycopene cyclase domain-containing protein